jgi:hypothetical protein
MTKTISEILASSERYGDESKRPSNYEGLTRFSTIGELQIIEDARINAAKAVLLDKMLSEGNINQRILIQARDQYNAITKEVEGE